MTVDELIFLFILVKIVTWIAIIMSIVTLLLTHWA